MIPETTSALMREYVEGWKDGRQPNELTPERLDRALAEGLDEAVRKGIPDLAALNTRVERYERALRRLGGMTHGEDTMRIIRAALASDEAGSE